MHMHMHMPTPAPTQVPWLASRVAHTLVHHPMTDAMSDATPQGSSYYRQPPTIIQVLTPIFLIKVSTFGGYGRRYYTHIRSTS